MSGLSEERRKEIEATLDRLERGYEWIAANALRDLLAESAALRTEVDALERQKAATNEALADALELAAHNGLAAPASPDDLARVAEIAERLGKATKGPWRVEWKKGRVAHLHAPRWTEFAHVHQLDYSDEGLDGHANADFIAHAPDDIGWLLARLTPPTGPA